MIVKHQMKQKVKVHKEVENLLVIRMNYLQMLMKIISVNLIIILMHNQYKQNDP